MVSKCLCTILFFVETSQKDIWDSEVKGHRWKQTRWAEGLQTEREAKA